MIVIRRINSCLKINSLQKAAPTTPSVMLNAWQFIRDLSAAFVMADGWVLVHSPAPLLNKLHPFVLQVCPLCLCIFKILKRNRKGPLSCFLYLLNGFVDISHSSLSVVFDSLLFQR